MLLNYIVANVKTEKHFCIADSSLRQRMQCCFMSLWIICRILCHITEAELYKVAALASFLKMNLSFVCMCVCVARL